MGPTTSSSSKSTFTSTTCLRSLGDCSVVPTFPWSGREPSRPDSLNLGVLEAPAEVQLPALDVERVAFLEVRDRRGRELVTVIELLSPSNKRPGDDRSQYLAKRREILRSTAHLVEIDLLRGWTPMPAEDRPEGDYSVLVSRAERRPAAEFWPIRLRDRLPVIPIPLRPTDPDGQIDLQDVLHQAYDGPGYEKFIYDGSPEPPALGRGRGMGRAVRPPPGLKSVPGFPGRRALPGRPLLPRGDQTSPQLSMTTLADGLPLLVPRASIFLTRSDPSVTSPKTTCLPSSQSVSTVVMKNCEPLVFGPALAIESRNGRSCLR